ncbi:MAG: DUF2249 domain-containing protein [Gaiellales bacterium]
MTAAPTEEAFEQLGRLLDQAVRALGDAGERDAACRLAAKGWWLVRDPAPRAARRLNATLHYLTVHPGNHDRKEEAMSTNPDQVLDVRSEPPARRHQLIFETYHGLGSGEGFVLVNDHDPKPLWYQFEAEHAGAYSWDYLEQGPEVWRVRIGRAG